MGPQQNRCGMLYYIPILYIKWRASMGPQQNRCGMMEQVLRNPKMCGKLQWGRNKIVAEWGPTRTGGTPRESASMGPQQTRCGMGSKVR